MPTSISETARINGAKSKGPVTAEGKARSSQNALKHGLTAASVMVEGEVLADYTDLRDAYIEQFQPATQMELDLVESLAATRIRLRRAVSIETGILDNKIRDLKGISSFQALDTKHRIADAFAYCPDSISLVSRYEGALNRAFDRTLKQLQALQKARLASPPQELRNEPRPLPEILEFPLTPDANDPDEDDYRVETLNSTLPESAVPE